MLGSEVLEIGIGLVLTFLCVSFVCTAATELIAALSRARARDLSRGIGKLLDGTVQRSSWSRRFFSHHLVNALSKDDGGPSYIPSQTFAMVLMDLVTREAAEADPDKPLKPLATLDEIVEALMKIKNDRIREALLPLVIEARTDLTAGVVELKKFNDQVEIWFNHSMDRVSGWYKRRTQYILFWLAVVTAFALNIDTIAIARALGTSKTLRASIVAVAQRTAEQGPRQTSTSRPTGSANDESDLSASVNSLRDTVTRIDQLGIPMGWISWDTAHPRTERKALEPAPENSDQARFVEARKHASADNLYDLFRFVLLDSPPRFAAKIAGLLFTALAASLGAPFWFDVLNKFMSVRAAGKAPEERPHEPKMVMQPQAPDQTPKRG